MGSKKDGIRSITIKQLKEVGSSAVSDLENVAFFGFVAGSLYSQGTIKASLWAAIAGM